MDKKRKCRFCGAAITRDCFNVAIKWERLDFPERDVDWQSGTEKYLEDICPKHYDELIATFKSGIRAMEMKYYVNKTKIAIGE